MDWELDCMVSDLASIFMQIISLNSLMDCVSPLLFYNVFFVIFSIFWILWNGRLLSFGGAVRFRPVEDIAFAVARFFQRGGTFQNYYMVLQPEMLFTSSIIYDTSVKKNWLSLKAISWYCINFYLACSKTVPWRDQLWPKYRWTFHCYKLWLWCTNRWIWYACTPSTIILHIYCSYCSHRKCIIGYALKKINK